MPPERKSPKGTSERLRRRTAWRHQVVELVGEIVGAAAGEIRLDEVVGEVPVLLDRDLAVLGDQQMAGRAACARPARGLNGAGK